MDSARYDVNALFDRVKNAKIGTAIIINGIIHAEKKVLIINASVAVRGTLERRALVLFHQDRRGFTKLNEISSERFKIWYTAMKSSDELDKGKKVWESRSEFNWARYKSYTKKGITIHFLE